MVRFLSPEWIAALDVAAREATVPGGVRLTIQQIVTDDDANDDADDDVRYHLVVDGGRLRVVPGEADAPDVTLIQTREVAAALSRGELNAQQALEAGRLKLRGDLGHLGREGKALSAMEDVFASVRAETSY